jgi:hypothetical protein
METVALIDDPGVIHRILTHLGLWRGRKSKGRGTAPHQEPELDADSVYEPAYAG